MIQDDDLAVLKARRDISRANLVERIGEVRHLAANPTALISRPAPIWNMAPAQPPFRRSISPMTIAASWLPQPRRWRCG
jgi:hypothetical protein